MLFCLEADRPVVDFHQVGDGSSIAPGVPEGALAGPENNHTSNGVSLTE